MAFISLLQDVVQHFSTTTQHRVGAENLQHTTTKKTRAYDRYFFCKRCKIENELPQSCFCSYYTNTFPKSKSLNSRNPSMDISLKNKKIKEFCLGRGYCF